MLKHHIQNDLVMNTTTRSFWWSALYRAQAEKGGFFYEICAKITVIEIMKTSEELFCMKYMLDTASVADIKKTIDFYPIIGVTTNPTILKMEGLENLESHLKAIQGLCEGRSFHVQLIRDTCEEMLLEAEKYIQLLGESIYLKVPVTQEGIKAIGRLKRQGKNVTATAIYYQAQGFLAMEAGADYIAPYCNRMENNDICFSKTIEGFRAIIDRDHYATQILAASFKNTTQINQAILSGAHAVTLQPDALKAATNTPLVMAAIDAFKNDFNEIR